MNAVLREYILKGVFLGLWAYLALLRPDWADVGRVMLWAGGGFAIGFVAGAVVQVLRGYRPLANLPGFLLLVLLDSSFFIYLGLIGGVAAGVLLYVAPEVPEANEALAAVAGGPAQVASLPGRDWLGWCALAGAVLGLLLYRLRQVNDRFWRLGLGLVLGAAIVYFAITYLGQYPPFATAEAQQVFARVLLLGLPFFYLLTFCGEAEESEVEIAALCAGLGIGLFLLRLSSNLPQYGDKLIFIVPIGLYFVYVTRVQPGLRVFKHTLRGFGNLSLGRTRNAILSFHRALQLDTRNALAAQGLWQLHRRVDVTQLDDDTVRFLNFDFCLDLAAGLIIKDRAPTESERAEATKMLDLVERQKPALLARVDYLRAVTQTHGKHFDAAAEALSRLLNPETPYQVTEIRSAVLLPAWNLALHLHPEIVKRLGVAELAKPGRRIEAIGAVERELAKQADDPVAGDLKRELYAGLSEAEFVSAAATAPPADFNYDYVEQLGLALIAETDPNRIERGMAYLRIAGRGLPQRGPTIFKTLADLATKLGHADEAHGYLGQVKRAGLTAGPANLSADQRDLYLAALKKLAEDNAARNDFAAAVDDMRLYVEGGKEDANTLRRLAELYAENKDALNALLITERGLLYAKNDPDLLAKKDSYYFSVDVDRLRTVKDKVSGWFDVAYCVRKAKQVADQKEADLDTLDYGLHLARLARVVAPENHAALLAEARLLLRKGERQQGLTILEDIREAKRGSGEEEDAWYIATRILGDLYLDELDRPDLAILCFEDYREYQRSGADTLFRLGQAYEAKGDKLAAKRAYDTVTAYPQHPRYWDATEAVRRLKEELNNK
ncbi:tetratricopeptide repeat protein [Fimbriiglobus ruber]|uniref:Tetratricopeptide repeat protein n=1 Tax=Fimbriiglobus ruber TaxID=1908690 RepID=A0A225E240_9BACT|nr:hypothetical protein [Fimbriiglobus ruber]OWK47303.1 hypothetical protein FRUB_01002 [Fimbriiglobus ruber]